MAQIVNSLFGITPEDLLEQRDASLRKEAMQYAQLDPMQQSQMAIYMGANKLGGVAGGLLGAQDPDLKRISLRQNLMKNVDLTDPQSLREAASQALQAGDAAGAQELAARALELEKTGAEVNFKKAEAAAKLTEKTTPEQKNAIALADSAFQRGTPEWTAAYTKELTRLTTTNQAQWEVKEVGVAAGTREAVYTLRAPGKEPRQVVYRVVDGEQKAVPYNGPVDRVTSTTSTSVAVKGQNAFAEKLGSKDAERVDAANTARDGAIEVLGALGELQRLNDQQLIGGSFATGRVGVANLFATMGLASSDDVARLSNSEQFAKVAKDLVMKTLGNKLGGGVSAADLKFVEGIVPQLENSAKARRELIEYIAKRSRAVIDEATRLDTYARENNGLRGFTPKIPFVRVGSENPFAGMTNEQLLAERARLAGKK